jgi:hypothetical protein
MAGGMAGVSLAYRLAGLPKPIPELAGVAGEDPAGTTIVVRGEQGAGDILHFARYLPLLTARRATVVLSGIAPALRPLLQECPASNFTKKGRW